MVQARNTNFSTDAQHCRKLGSPSAYVPGGGVSRKDLSEPEMPPSLFMWKYNGQS